MIKSESVSLNKVKPPLRIVHIWLFDSAGRLLICKRPENEEAFPGVWTSSAGGHVEEGEEYKEAAIRETQEELGITVEPEHAFLLPYDRGTHLNLIDLWFCSHSGEELTADPREIAEMRFVSMEKLANEMGEEPQKFNPEFVGLVRMWEEKVKALS